MDPKHALKWAHRPVTDLNFSRHRPVTDDLIFFICNFINRLSLRLFQHMQYKLRYGAPKYSTLSSHSFLFLSHGLISVCFLPPSVCIYLKKRRGALHTQRSPGQANECSGHLCITQRPFHALKSRPAALSGSIKAPIKQITQRAPFSLTYVCAPLTHALRARARARAL